jgi:predicted nucleic acid-binding protein
MKFVFDTSAIAPNYIEEDTSKMVRELIRKCIMKSVEIQCSELAFYELGNVLVKAEVTEGQEVLRKFREIFPDPVPSSTGLEKICFNVSDELKFTYYDSVHVSLSKYTGSKLVTNDKLILKKYEDSCTPSEALGSLTGLKDDK